MHTYSRWQAAAILGIALVLSLAALPNVLPDTVLWQLPRWAQQRVVLGYDLQGGSRIQVAIDRDHLKQWQLDGVREDLRRSLRKRGIVHSAVVVRNGGVEVTLLERADLPRALKVLDWLVAPDPAETWSQFASGRNEYLMFATYVDGRPSVTAGPPVALSPPRFQMDAHDRLVRVAMTESAIRQDVARARKFAIELTDRRMRTCGVSYDVTRVGVDRLAVEVRGALDPERCMQY